MPEGSSQSGRPRVLLVEDEAGVRNHLAESLSDEFDIDTAADGEQALIAVLRHRPHLIVTDIVMPTLDGVELVRMLRETPSTANIPILLTSGRAPEELRIVGLEMGADSYLAKPYSERELRARMRNMLQTTKRREEAAHREAFERTAAERAALLESITDAFFALDADGRFTYVNQRALDFFAKSRAELLGNPIWDVITFGDDGLFKREFERAKHSQDSAGFEAQTPDGRWIEVHAYPGGHGIAVNFRDISDRKNAVERMKEAERRKDAFVATLAHELRNPLAPIRNGIHILKARTGDSPELGEVLGMMDRQMTHMVRLLDDLLDLSRITRGKLELKRRAVRLEDALDAALESTQGVIHARRHTLERRIRDADVIIDGDPTRLAQIFANLISNAAKYTDPGGRITLTVERDGGAALVSVADSGIGLAPEMISGVFEMFSQVRPHGGRVNAGLGIGLSVVKTLVQMHGGGVDVHSEGLGKGSTFRVRLPALPAVVQEPAQAEAAPADGPRVDPRRILVVDDNRDSAQTLAMLLEAQGHAVRSAYSGEEAVEITNSFRPDLILMDIGMPKVDGYEASRRIRARNGAHPPYIVALTGWGQDSDRLRSREAGMDEHLVKPVDPEALDEIIRRLHAPARMVAAE